MCDADGELEKSLDKDDEEKVIAHHSACVGYEPPVAPSAHCRILRSHRSPRIQKSTEVVLEVCPATRSASRSHDSRNIPDSSHAIARSVTRRSLHYDRYSYGCNPHRHSRLFYNRSFMIRVRMMRTEWNRTDLHRLPPRCHRGALLVELRSHEVVGVEK